MALIYIEAHELRKALADIKAAERNGFMFCRAVLEPSAVSSDGALGLSYSDLWERASITPDKDWGRFQGVSSRHRYVDGRLVPIKTKREPSR